MCECSSIIPAVRYLPVASTTLAPPADKFVPMREIFPFLIRTSVFSSIPASSPVHTVAFLNRMSSCLGLLAKPKATLGKATGITSGVSVDFSSFLSDFSPSATAFSVLVAVKEVSAPVVEIALPVHVFPSLG